MLKIFIQLHRAFEEMVKPQPQPQPQPQAAPARPAAFSDLERIERAVDRAIAARPASPQEFAKILFNDGDGVFVSWKFHPQQYHIIGVVFCIGDRRYTGKAAGWPFPRLRQILGWP